MKNYNDETKFENVFEELKYEVQDVVDLLSHVFGQKSGEKGFLDLIGKYVQRPANDNWPIYKSTDDKVIKVNVK